MVTNPNRKFWIYIGCCVLIILYLVLDGRNRPPMKLAQGSDETAAISMANGIWILTAREKYGYRVEWDSLVGCYVSIDDAGNVRGLGRAKYTIWGEKK